MSTFPEGILVGPSPHIAARDSIPRIMWTVAIALLPALAVSYASFGWYALAVVLVGVLGAAVTETLIQRLRGMPVTISDGSAVVTGMLLAMTLPPSVPLYLPLVGSVVAIGVAKHAFGGLGFNIWNPALVGRAFLLAAYSGAVVMSKWPMLGSAFKGNILTDAVTKATPLMVLKESPLAFFESYNLWELAVGLIPGSVGETSAIALLIGGIFLIWRGVINWRLPLSYIGSVMILVAVLPMSDGQGGHIGIWQAAFWKDPTFILKVMAAHALSGGLMLGAFFMATDMVTSPLTPKGQVLFGVGCGALVVIIRLWGGYPEGVCYSILIMNTAVWLIDRATKPTLFGATKEGANA